MAMVVIRPSPSPSRGRPGWGWVLLVRWRFERCRGGRETHPHPTLPLKGRAFRRLRGGFELGGPVLLDLADQFRWQRHVVEVRSEEHTSELQSLMRISYAVFCLKK